MMKKISISLLIIALLASPLFSIPAANALFSSEYISCSSYLDSIERTQNYIKEELVYDYHKNLTYAEIYPSYRDKFLNLAQRNLESIISFYGHIADDVRSLSNCKGMDSLSQDEITLMLRDIYDFMISDAMSLIFTKPGDGVTFDSIKYHMTVISFLRSVNKLELGAKFSGLVDQVVANDNDKYGKSFAIFQSVLNYQNSTFADLMTYRQTSLDDPTNANAGITAILWADRLNMIYEQLKDYPSKSKIKFLNKNALIGHGASVTGTNFLQALQRGLLTEGFMAVFLQGAPVTADTAFLEDFAGNLAAITTAGNRLGLALVYMELNADLMTYVNSRLAPVFEEADRNSEAFLRAQQDLEHVNVLMDTTTRIIEARLNDNDSDRDFSLKFVKELEVLHEKTVDIYKIDPSVIKIYVDGRMLDTTNMTPYNKNGTIMIPLRLVSEAVGITPVWDKISKTVTITKEIRGYTVNGKQATKDIVLTVGSTKAKNGYYSVNLDVAPAIKKGSVYVPLRFVAEALGFEVDWVKPSNSVVLKSK